MSEKPEWKKAEEAAIARFCARLKEASNGRDLVCVAWGPTGEPIWEFKEAEMPDD